MTHEPVTPTSDNGWASWWCPDCGTACASDNPCDCCNDDAWPDVESAAEVT